MRRRRHRPLPRLVLPVLPLVLAALLGACGSDEASGRALATADPTLSARSPSGAQEPAVVPTEGASPTPAEGAPAPARTVAPATPRAATPPPTEPPASPTATPRRERAPDPTPAAERPRPERQRVHTVAEGDTLWDVSRRYGVTVAALARANGLSEESQLSVGQRLRIPAGAARGGVALPEMDRSLQPPGERPLIGIAPGLVRFLRARAGESAAAVYLPATDTLYAYNGDEGFAMASTVKAPIMVTSLAQLYERNPDARRAGSPLLAPMITVSDNDAATALLARVGGPSAVEAELRARGVRGTEVNPEAWGLSTTTASDMALLMRSLYYGERLNPALRDVAVDLMAGVVAEQRWGVPAGLPQVSRIAFKGGWLPVRDGWLVHQIGIAEIGGESVIFAFLNKGQPSFGYGQQTLERSAQFLSDLDVGK